MGKVGEFCRRWVLISMFTMPRFEVSELTARSAARPVGDVGDTPGHFYARIKYQSPRSADRGLSALNAHCFGDFVSAGFVSAFFNCA